MKALILTLFACITLSSFVSSQSQFNGLCSACIANDYQYCGGNCLAFSSSCTSSNTTNLYMTCPSQEYTASPCQMTYNIGGNNTASNRVYIDTTLAKGQWCFILIQNGISSGNDNTAHVKWYINTNTTASVFTKS